MTLPGQGVRFLTHRRLGREGITARDGERVYQHQAKTERRSPDPQVGRPGKGAALLSEAHKPVTPDLSVDPMKRFNTPRMTRRENIVKRVIDAYHVSDVDDTAVIYMGDRALSIYQSLDLPDLDCEGLTFKRRVVVIDNGDCLLIARWKPDRQMRRAAPHWSQKWFVEKKLFPPNADRFFARLERRLEQANEDDAPD